MVERLSKRPPLSLIFSNVRHLRRKRFSLFPAPFFLYLSSPQIRFPNVFSIHVFLGNRLKTSHVSLFSFCQTTHSQKKENLHTLWKSVSFSELPPLFSYFISSQSLSSLSCFFEPSKPGNRLASVCVSLESERGKIFFYTFLLSHSIYCIIQEDVKQVQLKMDGKWGKLLSTIEKKRNEKVSFLVRSLRFPFSLSPSVCSSPLYASSFPPPPLSSLHLFGRKNLEDRTNTHRGKSNTQDDDTDIIHTPLLYTYYTVREKRWRHRHPKTLHSTF